MNIEIFALCDAAADYQGRLSILGVFDTIFAAQLPAIHPFCSVALRMRFDRIEHGAHQLRLGIVNQDGNEVTPELEGAFTVEMPRNEQVASVNLVLNLAQLRFSNYGEYEIKLAIDQNQKDSLSFWVKKLQE